MLKKTPAIMAIMAILTPSTWPIKTIHRWEGWKGFWGDFRVTWTIPGSCRWSVAICLAAFAQPDMLQLQEKWEHFLLRFPKYLCFVSLANLYKSLSFVVLSSLPFFSVERMAASFCMKTILMIGMLWAFLSGWVLLGGREDHTTTGKLIKWCFQQFFGMFTPELGVIQFDKHIF